MSQLKLTADSGGGTVAIKGPASTTGNAALEMIVPSAASDTLDSLKRAGNILQVVSATKTDAFSTSSTTFTDVTGMSIAITPSSSSNKILVRLDLNFGSSDNGYFGFKLYRDSTWIGQSTAVTSGNQINATFGLSCGNDNNDFYKLHSGAYQILDSPSTTSAITYKIQVNAYDSRTFYLNRPHNDNNQSYIYGGTSSITAMEVAA